MERKWLIAIAIIVIVVIGGLGYYFFFIPREAPKQLAKVYIDAKNYTTPIMWNLTDVNGTRQTQVHNITSAETNSTSISFSYTVWHFDGTQWTEQFNGTRWFVAQHVYPTIAPANNNTGASGYAFANKSSEKATYLYTLTYTDDTIYLTLNYTGTNPTVDGQTTFAYAAFDGNGNNILDASDKAFNFTHNPNLATQNHLTIYTPTAPYTWNTTGTDYSWNGNVSTSDVPIAVVFSNDLTDITFAIPFNYIGATSGQSLPLGFVLQAFSHDWTPATANPANPATFIKSSLTLQEASSFNMSPFSSFRFYVKARFDSTATGQYSIIFNFQVKILKSS